MAVDNELTRSCYWWVTVDKIAKFAEDLRKLRAAAGSPSYRSLERVAHYSRTTLAQAAAGRVLPSLPVTLAFVAACGGDTVEWERRWRSVSVALRAEGATVAGPWPPEPVADGADPEAAGCGHDAVTVHARKIALIGRRNIVGQVELRYSPGMHAAWGRFEGFSGLDHMAHRRRVEVLVAVARDSDGAQMSYRDDYWFDYHWSSVLCTGTGQLWALASVLFDGETVAAGQTDRFQLA